MEYLLNIKIILMRIMDSKKLENQNESAKVKDMKYS